MRIINYQSVFSRGFTFSLTILNITLFCSSCVTYRNLEYLSDRDKKDEVIKTFDEAKIPDYKLKPKDELYIQIKSLDDPSTNVFQQLGVQQNDNVNYIQPYGASLISNVVDKEGYIQLPFIGNIQVEDKSVQEVTAILQDSLNHMLSKPTVTVKLVNRFVSVVGEVQRPGHFSYSQEKLTIFDAISMAGDITDYGDRKDVILARNENGKNLHINLDLTSSNFMASEFYYIRPNDMIYVKPMRKKFWGLNQFPWSVLLTTISSSLLLYTVFK